VAETACPGLEDDVAVDVAVIGGGSAGATAATLLKLSGKRMALLEARRVGRQVTGQSSAKTASLRAGRQRDPWACGAPLTPQGGRR
jgi:glycine/D-amino acid oxidase-like deaminating enzyme